VGPLCDRFGPRYVFAGVLIAGALPSALAGTVTSAAGLMVLRFFVGILGASFVPCQVWSTGFFDKSVIGASNSLMAGIGNAGGGITYFVMPAIFNSLVKSQGLTPHKAWRVAFIVPFILITATALGMIFFCEDTPTGMYLSVLTGDTSDICFTGPWNERHLHAKQTAHQAVVEGRIVDATGHITDLPIADDKSSGSDVGEMKKDVEANMSEADAERIEKIAESEVIQAPTLKEAMEVTFSLQCLLLSAAYMCSFGGELAINSVLGAYYSKNFPHLGQTRSGQWAAMFGLLNAVFRPVGGIVCIPDRNALPQSLTPNQIADSIYRATNGSVVAKKFWLIFLGTVMGALCLCIGLVDTHHLPTMVGLILCLAFFLEACNGANFAVVPHVFPHANGKPRHRPFDSNRD
jgi:NNP family nitrate/nitrite transporter-like MFS transporter